MRKMAQNLLLVMACMTSTVALAMPGQEAGHAVAGHTYEWHWDQGAFKGAAFRVAFQQDGQLHWEGIEGGAIGKKDTEKQYQSAAVSKAVQIVSWQEKSGYTVTIVLNFGDGTCQGIVSNQGEWYPLSGNFKQIQ